MISIRGHGRPCRERPTVILFVTPFDFSPPPELGDKLSDQPAELSEIKPPIANVPAIAISVPKYSKDDL